MSQAGGDGKKLGSGDDDGEKKGKENAAQDSSDESSRLWSSSDDDDTANFDGLVPALENSLPMKRGLGGKTKSFGNLADVPEHKNEVLKKEHPINKKRRLLLAHEMFHGDDDDDDDDDKKAAAGGSGSANVGPLALPSGEAALYDVKDEGTKTATDDDDDI